VDATFPTRDSCVLPPLRTSPAAARRFVATALRNWGLAETFSDVILVTSELVTNAVRHAASEVAVSIDLLPDGVRVEVQDLSEQPPVKDELGRAGDGGWGLHIVERLATRYGLEPRAGGKTVWCELRRPTG